MAGTTAFEGWASSIGQIGNDAFPPDSAVRPGRPERRVCARLQPFAAEVDPTRLSLLTVANAEMRMVDEIDRTLARPSGAARVLSATGGEGRQIRPQTHRRGPPYERRPRRRRRAALPPGPTDCHRDPYRRRFFASAMLRSPGGFGGGIGSDRGAGGSSLARIALKLLTRGDSGKRSAAIVSRSSAARMALSSSVRSGVIAGL
jgi:hypothetical protein